MEAVKESAIAILPKTKDLVTSIKVANLPVQELSDLIVRSIDFGEKKYFPVLTVLDSDQTNLNHQSLAELAKLNQVKAIVTTNFDTIIERAFRNEGIPLQVLSQERDYQELLAGPRCVLYIVHGSVAVESSLIDTVTQKSRGLSLLVKNCLKAVFESYHLLVIGFSGADLEIDKDYTD